MKGKPLDDARAAARLFVERMRAGDEVAIVAFSARPQVVAPFTTDRATLLAALDKLQTGGETALYDSITLSAQTLAGSHQDRRALVLLSDGGDTVSSADLKTALQAIGPAKGIPVYAVALQSPEADLNGLKSIATASGGRFLTTSESSGLTAIYRGIAKELQTQYEIAYTSNRPQTKNLEIELSAGADGRTASGWVVVDNPALLAGAAPGYRFPVPTVGGFGAFVLLSLFFVLAFFSASLFAYSAIGVALPERPSVDQLAFYDQIRSTKGTDKQPKSALHARVLDAVRHVASERGFTQLVNERLERAGLPLRPAEYILFHLLAVIGLGMASSLASGSAIVGLVVVVLATVIPIYVLEVVGRRRQQKFDDQLPDILNLISGSLRAGYGLQQSIGLIVQEVKNPAAEEFKRVQTEARLGLPLEDALEKMAARLGSEDFRWAVMAMNIQREVGGNLAEVLDIVAKTVRERDELRRQVKTLTEESRISAIVLGILPFFVAAVLFFVNPGYIMGLVIEPMGRLLILLALVLLTVGIFWLRQVMTIEV
jgi:tight adherence protein B